MIDLGAERKRKRKRRVCKNTKSSKHKLHFQPRAVNDPIYIFYNLLFDAPFLDLNPDLVLPPSISNTPPTMCAPP